MISNNLHTNFQNTLKGPGSKSGYKINWNELELLGLTEQTYHTLLRQWDFQWSPTALKHSGTLIPRDLEQTLKINVHLTITQIINDLVNGYLP